MRLLWYTSPLYWKPRLFVRPSPRAQVASLLADEALVVVPTKCANYVNIFSLKPLAELPEHTAINDHAIGLVYASAVIKPFPVRRHCKLQSSHPGLQSGQGSAAID